jgi:hypothetical protein
VVEYKHQKTLLTANTMSQLNSSSCVNVNTGRPQQDAGYHNFSVSSGSAVQKGSFCEASIAAAVVGELIADTGAFNSLVVDSLTVTGLSSAEPSVVTLPWQIAVLDGATAVNYVYSAPPAATITWTLNVPASTTRAIRFAFTGTANDTHFLDITVNGIDVGTVTATGAAPNLVDTSLFNWPGGSMVVVATNSDDAVTVSLTGDPVVI